MAHLRGERSEKTKRFTSLKLPCLIAVIFAFQFLALSTVRSAEPEPFPLQPPDTSSPRATIESFLFNTMNGIKSLREVESAETVLSWFSRADACLDLSGVSSDRARVAGTEAGLLIYEILTRAGLPDMAEIPGKEEVQEQALEAWAVPRTEMKIVRVKEGDRAGEYLFSPDTVARALQDYKKVKHLAPKPEFIPGSYEMYVTGPNLTVPYLWVEALPSWANVRFLRNPLWKWLAMLATLALGVVAAILIRRVSLRWDRSLSKHAERWRVGVLVFAAGLIVIPLILDFLIENVIGVRFELATFIAKGLLALAFAAGVYFLLTFFEHLARVVISSRQLRKQSVDAHFIRVGARILGIVVSLYFIIEATEYLGLHLAPILAGLGVGGLAVALAARPALENIIGGLILFADKPVRVGDYCQFGDEMGWVEEIGLRSTRIRRLDDKLVTIPNAEFSGMPIQNYARMRERLYSTTLTFRYETTPEQLRFLLAALREMLLSHPMVSKNRLHVRFLGFGAYSLDVELFAFIRTTDLLEFKTIREDINLRIMDIVKDAGTGFAFPSQTAYLGRDVGIDTERGRQAEETVEDWRAKAELPFPEFDKERSQKIEDSLAYPPEGSPDYAPRSEMSEEDVEPKPQPKPTITPGRKKTRPQRGKTIRPLRQSKT